jgi:hypothetical protein
LSVPFSSAQNGQFQHSQGHCLFTAYRNCLYFNKLLNNVKSFVRFVTNFSARKPGDGISGLMCLKLLGTEEIRFEFGGQRVILARIEGKRWG